MIGGAPTTRAWADEIGADGYAEDAIEAVVTPSRCSGSRDAGLHTTTGLFSRRGDGLPHIPLRRPAASDLVGMVMPRAAPIVSV